MRNRPTNVLPQCLTPNTNRVVEEAKKSILQAMSKQVKEAEGDWMDEIPSIAWFYHSTYKNAIREKLFQLSLVKVSAKHLKIRHFSWEQNKEALRVN